MMEPPATSNDSGQKLQFDVPVAFLWKTTARESDIDAQGHVNNSVYVQWMDKAAYAHSQAVGYDWEMYQKIGSSFVVRRHEVDYLSPAFAGDAIIVATWPTEMERFTAMRQHQILRISDGKTLARAKTTWIFINSKTQRPQRMPPELIAAFKPCG